MTNFGKIQLKCILLGDGSEEAVDKFNAPIKIFLSTYQSQDILASSHCLKKSIKVHHVQLGLH